MRTSYKSITTRKGKKGRVPVHHKRVIDPRSWVLLDGRLYTPKSGNVEGNPG